MPERGGRLDGPGRLQALALRDQAGADTRNWTGLVMAPRSTREARWIDLAEPESPADDLRLRGRAAGAAIFARGEGIHLGDGEFYFGCTSGGAVRAGQIMRYRPAPAKAGRTKRAARRLHLFVELPDPRCSTYADNLTIAPWGHLIVCEDHGGGGDLPSQGGDARRTHLRAGRRPRRSTPSSPARLLLAGRRDPVPQHLPAGPDARHHRSLAVAAQRVRIRARSSASRSARRTG